MPIENRTPENFLPSRRDLLFLVGHSPRGELVCDVWRGRTTAAELCALLWPGVDPDAPYGVHGAAPAAWITEVLDHESTPCTFGGAGTCEREGDEYLAVARDNEGIYPTHLPRWPLRAYAPDRLREIAELLADLPHLRPRLDLGAECPAAVDLLAALGGAVTATCHAEDDGEAYVIRRAELRVGPAHDGLVIEAQHSRPATAAERAAAFASDRRCSALGPSRYAVLTGQE